MCVSHMSPPLAGAASCIDAAISWVTMSNVSFRVDLVSGWSRQAVRRKTLRWTLRGLVCDVAIVDLPSLCTHRVNSAIVLFLNRAKGGTFRSGAGTCRVFTAGCLAHDKPACASEHSP